MLDTRVRAAYGPGMDRVAARTAQLGVSVGAVTAAGLLVGVRRRASTQRPRPYGPLTKSEGRIVVRHAVTRLAPFHRLTARRHV